MRSDAVARPPPRERKKHHGRDDAGGRQGHDHRHRDQRRGRSRGDAGYIESRQRPVRRRRMSFTLHGISVSSGIAIGHAHLVSHTSLEVAHYVLPKKFINEEIARFDAALQTTRNEISRLRSNRPTQAASEFDAFLELHQMILDDPLLSVAPREMIAGEHCNAEWALKVQTETLVAQLIARTAGSSADTIAPGYRNHSGGARLEPCRPDPVHAATICRIHYRCGRRDLAYRDCRAQPEHTLCGRLAPCARTDPRR